MEEQKRNPGRPRKWASDAERMRAYRAAKREERVAEGARKAERSEVRHRPARSSPSAPTGQETGPTDTSARATDPTATDHAGCETTIRALRDELAWRNELCSDMALSQWVLEQKHKRVLGRMRSHDPDGIAWLEEELGDWEREVQEKRMRGLCESNRQQARRRYEEELEQRIELARRAAKD